MKSTYKIKLPDGSTRIRKHNQSLKYPATFAIAWFDHKRNKWDATVYLSFQSADKMIASYDPNLKATFVQFDLI